MGLAYSILASALWSLPDNMIKPQMLATAFGIMQALQNLGTALITIGAGQIVDNYGYYWMEMFLTGWFTLSLICSLIIWLLDYKNQTGLNLSASQAQFDQKEKEKLLLVEEERDNSSSDAYIRSL